MPPRVYCCARWFVGGDDFGFVMGVRADDPHGVRGASDVTVQRTVGQQAVVIL
jgi:hypothetical protein